MTKLNDCNINTISNFDTFCKVCFSELDADKRVSLYNRLITDNIKKILQDKELVDSLESFFANNLNISETSRNTFVHRNTIVYRLDKIKRITGFDVRNFDDAVCFRMFLWLNKGSK